MATVLLICLGILTVILIFINPMIGFIAVILLIPASTFPSLTPSFFNIIQNITPIKVIGGVTVVSAFMHRMVDKERAQISLSPQAVIFIIYLIYIVMSGFLQRGAQTRVVFTKYISFTMFFYLTTVLIGSVKRFKITIWACVLTMALASFMALFEYIRLQKYGVVRPSAMFGDSNLFAISLLIVLSFAYYRILGEKSIRNRFLAIGSFGILFTSLILTLSRGGMIGFMGGFVTAVLKIKKKGWIAIILILGIIVTGLIMPKEFWHRVDIAKQEIELQDKTADLSTERRIMLVKAGWRMFVSKPVFGVGPGNFYWKSREFADIIAGMSHNVYIGVLAELGIVGFLLFIGLIHLTLRDLRFVIKKAKQIQKPELLNFANSIQVGFIGFLISAIFLHAEYEKFFWLAIFLTICLKKLSEEKEAVS